MCRISLGRLGLVLALAPILVAQEPSPPAPPTAAEQQTILKCADATRKAETAIASSIELRTAASAGITQLNSLTSDLSGSTAQALTGLADAVRKLADVGLPAALADAQSNLNLQKKALTDTCGDAVTAPQALEDAQRAAKSASSNVDDEIGQIEKTTTSLNVALDKVPSSAVQIFDSLSEKVKSIKELKVPSDKEPLPEAGQKVFTQGLPGLADVLEQMTETKPAWQRLSKLDVVAASDLRKASVSSAQEKLKSLDADLASIAGHLAPWVAALSISAADPKQKAADAVTKVLLDPSANTALAAGEQKDANQALARINAVLSIWPRLSLALKEQPSVDTDDLSNKIATLSADGRALQSLVARIADALAGDMSQFVTEHVRLYYFTDVDRLMRALNTASYQVGGLTDAQAQAAAQRKALANAEFDLADAQSEVNRIQKSVLELREQQRQQAAAADAANLIVLKLQNGFKKAQRQQQSAEDALSTSQTSLTNSPNDPSLKAAVGRAQAKKDATVTATARANDQYTQAQSDATAASDKLEATKADQNGVPAKLALAQQTLETAQAALSVVRRRMLVAAQAESEAFANARDHTPFWVSDAVAADTDPVKHVIIFGFPDNATLLLRGKPDDVLKAREMIATFDKPAPQARLTLWTFEINSDMGQFYRGSGAKNLNEAMEIVDEELGNTRSLVSATLNLLLTEINKQVRAKKGCFQTTKDQDAKALKLGPPTADKWDRIHFFSQEALTAFGLDLDQPDAETINHLLPEPSATTTLGEGLLLLSLSCSDTRHDVQVNFNSGLLQRLQELDLRTRHGDSLRELDLKTKMDLPSDLNKAFARTWQALGLPAYDKGLTSEQFEIVFALKDRYELRYRDRILAALHRSIAQFSETRQDFNESFIIADRLKTTGRQRWLQRHPSANLPQLKADLRNAERESLDSTELASLDEAEEQKTLADTRRKSIAARDSHLLQTLSDKYKLRPFDLAGQRVSPDLGKATGRESSVVSLFEQEFRNKVPSEGEVARVAAADEMIKKMIIAVEDDLDSLYIRPMLHRLRARLLKEGNVRVGVLQRESMLVSNRRAARIDPRASAQLQVGEEQDILSSVQQLAQLYLTAQSGGALGAIGALQKQPHEKPPEIYGVGTGNTFQVTPVFDPSGQALRFKFDYVGSTRVTEPSGGVDPQLPRIERHTINTEVQLSNLETREISRFEADSKIGIPSRYWGGIPIVKDIPYVRPYIPLLGWFVRRAGQNAAAQQSVIFGQTTIYPSISDLGVLLSPIDLTESLF